MTRPTAEDLALVYVTIGLIRGRDHAGLHSVIVTHDEPIRLLVWTLTKLVDLIDGMDTVGAIDFASWIDAGRQTALAARDGEADL